MSCTVNGTVATINPTSNVCDGSIHWSSTPVVTNEAIARPAMPNGNTDRT